MWRFVLCCLYLLKSKNAASCIQNGSAAPLQTTSWRRNLDWHDSSFCVLYIITPFLSLNLHKNFQFQFSVRSSVDMSYRMDSEQVQTIPHNLNEISMGFGSFIHCDGCGFMWLLYSGCATRLQTDFQGLCKCSNFFLNRFVQSHSFILELIITDLSVVRKYKSQEVSKEDAAFSEAFATVPHVKQEYFVASGSGTLAIITLNCHHTYVLHIIPEYLRRTWGHL